MLYSLHKYLFVKDIPVRLFLMLLVIFYTSTLFADVTMKKTISRPSLPIEKPERPIIHPPHAIPVVNTGIVYQDNYYNDNMGNSCQSYIDQIATLNQKISTLQLEVDRLQAREDVRLRKTLQEKNKKELEAFDNRKSTIKSKNSIEIKSK